MTTPEGRVKNFVKRELDRLRVRYSDRLFIRMPPASIYGKPMLDWLIIARGTFGVGQAFMIETKKDAKHDLTPRQQETKREAEAAGCRVYKVYDEQTAIEAIGCIERWLEGLL